MRKLRVGYLKHDQNWNKNICCHEYETVNLVRVFSLSRIVSALSRRLGKRIRWLEHTVLGPAWPNVDVLHVWAAVSFIHKPWIVTSDVGLPFHWRRDQWGRALRALAEDRCRRIIFISNYALKWQMRKLPQSGELHDKILAKATVLHTPQKALISSYDEKPLGDNNVVRFALVGHHFFRKGGLAILNALNVLRREGHNVEFVVVSKLAPDGFMEIAQEERNQILSQLSQSSWIKWYPSLPNREVLDIFKKSHIGVLLSFAESYGYSVLEAQANGCAILSTDIGALPELNNDKCGWVVSITDIPFDLQSTSSLRSLQEELTQRLVPILREIVSSPEQIREKGIRSLEKIRREHDPSYHKSCLENIYHTSLARRKRQ